MLSAELFANRRRICAAASGDSSELMSPNDFDWNPGENSDPSAVFAASE
jgi:hypothetical protein